MEGNVAGVRFAVGGEYLDAAAVGDGRGFAHDPAFADAGRAQDADDAAGPGDGLVEDGGDGVEFPGAADQLWVGARVLIAGSGDQAARGHRVAGPLDVHHFRLGQHHRILDQPRG